MTVCPQCFTHVGPTRMTCGGMNCGVGISRDHPEGAATHAYKDGRVVFMRRQNAAREFEQRHKGARAQLRDSTVLGQVNLDSLGYRDDRPTVVGAFGYGRAS